MDTVLRLLQRLAALAQLRFHAAELLLARNQFGIAIAKHPIRVIHDIELQLLFVRLTAGAHSQLVLLRLQTIDLGGIFNQSRLQILHTDGCQLRLIVRLLFLRPSSLIGIDASCSRPAVRWLRQPCRAPWGMTWQNGVSGIEALMSLNSA